MGAPSSHRRIGKVLVAIPLALVACGRMQGTEQPTPGVEAPDPPGWFVGEEDRTTPVPSPEPRNPARVVADVTPPERFPSVVDRSGTVVRLSMSRALWALHRRA